VSQSIIEMNSSYVVKRYNDKPHNKLSSVDSELYMLNRFDSIHAPKILRRIKNGYVMERYDYPLGTTKRLERECPNMLDNLNSIQADLVRCGILHWDINPGNLLYSKRNGCLKLIDFYWATPVGGKRPDIPKLNQYYGIDEDAFDKLRSECGQGN